MYLPNRRGKAIGGTTARHRDNRVVGSRFHSGAILMKSGQSVMRVRQRKRIDGRGQVRLYLPAFVLLTLLVSYLPTLISLAPPANSSSTSSPWPVGRQNARHSGLSPYAGPSAPVLKWSFDLQPFCKGLWCGGDVPPVIGSDGTVYTSSGDSHLIAINPDGTQKWNFSTGASVWGAAIGMDGTVYAGTGNALYALNFDGTEKWSLTGAGVPTLGSDETLYVGRGHSLLAINPGGKQKWNFSTGGSFRGGPAIGSGGTIYFTSSDSKLYAVNPDGTLQWSFPTGSDSIAIGPQGTIYIGSGGCTNYNYYAINPDGMKKWSFGTEGFSSPAIASDGTVYVGSGGSYFYAINPDGTQKWNFSIPEGEESFSPVIGSDGMIYVDANPFKLLAIGDASPARSLTTANSSSGGFPGFPYQLLVVIAFAVVVVSYVLGSRRPSDRNRYVGLSRVNAPVPIGERQNCTT